MAPMAIEIKHATHFLLLLVHLYTILSHRNSMECVMRDTGREAATSNYSVRRGSMILLHDGKSQEQIYQIK